MCFYFVYLYIFFSFFSSAVSMFCGCRSFACALSIKWHNYIPLGPTFHGIWRLKGHGRVVSSRPVVPQGKSIPFRGKELLSAVLCRPVFRYRVADGSTLCTSVFVCVCGGGGGGIRLPTPVYSVLVSVSVSMALSTVFHSINPPDDSPFSRSVLPVLSLPCRSFQLYISKWGSPSALI